MKTWTDIITNYKESVCTPNATSVTHNVVDVETRVTIVESQEPIDRKLGAQVVIFS